MIRSHGSAAAAAALGLSLVVSAGAAWFSLGAEASTANLTLSVRGDDRAAVISADGKQLTFSDRGPLGSAFSFSHVVTVANTGDTDGSGTLALSSTGSAPLAQAIRGRAVQLTPTAKALVDASLQRGGTAPLALPAHSTTTLLVTFTLSCAPLGTLACADVSGQSVTAVLQLVQTGVPVQVPAVPGGSTPQPVHVETPAPTRTADAPTSERSPSPSLSRPAAHEPPALSLGPPSLFTGGGGTISGQSCPPGVAVTFRANGLVVGATTSRPDGSFAGAVQLSDISAGSHAVEVTCGGRTVEGSVDLSLSTSGSVASSVGAAAGVVLLFLLLLGTLLYARTSEVGKSATT